MAKNSYDPPKQSAAGQLVDTLFLLALVFAALFAPLYLGLAGGGKIALEFADKTWKGMGQNETMAAAWEKLGYTPEKAVDIAAARFDYVFSPVALGVTALVVIAYFFIVIHYSKAEYKDVIAERFEK
jgi:hypothetical protein